MWLIIRILRKLWEVKTTDAMGQAQEVQCRISFLARIFLIAYNGPTIITLKAWPPAMYWVLQLNLSPRLTWWRETADWRPQTGELQALTAADATDQPWFYLKFILRDSLSVKLNLFKYKIKY
jgi:hypothetical protein